MLNGKYTALTGEGDHANHQQQTGAIDNTELAVIALLLRNELLAVAVDAGDTVLENTTAQRRLNRENHTRKPDELTRLRVRRLPPRTLILNDMHRGGQQSLNRLRLRLKRCDRCTGAGPARARHRTHLHSSEQKHHADRTWR